MLSIEYSDKTAHSYILTKKTICQHHSIFEIYFKLRMKACIIFLTTTVKIRDTCCLNSNINSLRYKINDLKDPLIEGFQIHNCFKEKLVKKGLLCEKQGVTRNVTSEIKSVKKNEMDNS